MHILYGGGNQFKAEGTRWGATAARTTWAAKNDMTVSFDVSCGSSAKATLMVKRTSSSIETVNSGETKSFTFSLSTGASIIFSANLSDTTSNAFCNLTNIKVTIKNHKSVAKKIEKMYIGVDGKAKAVNRAYIGVDGKAKLFYNKENENQKKTINITADNINDYFNVSVDASSFDSNSNGIYYFFGDGNAFISSNKGLKSSTASTILTAEYDMDVSFNYSYSSESNFDKFYLSFAGAEIESAASGTTITKSYSGSLKRGQTIEFKYVKDSSTDSNDDQCAFYDLQITYTEGVSNLVEKATYIESTGTQWINTLIRPKSTLTIEIDFQIIDRITSSDSQPFWGARDYYDPKQTFCGYYHYSSTNQVAMVFGNEQDTGWKDMTGNVFERTTLKYVGNDGIYENGKKIASVSEEIFENFDNDTITIFGLFTRDTADRVRIDTRLQKMKLYGFKVYDNDILVRNFVPVSNGKYCLLDEVENKIYKNQGMGEFNGG